MNTPSPRYVASFILRAIVSAGGLWVATAAGADVAEPSADPRGDEEIHIREVFTSHLPETMQANTLRLSIHPHFGDLHRKDNLRLSSGVRYGLTSNWEAGLETDFFLSHGLGDERFFKQRGLATAQPSTKYNLGDGILPGWDAAVGADLIFPIGRPPAELTDGLRHYGPWVTFSRRIATHRGLRVFWGVGFDFIEPTHLAGTLEKGQIRDDNVYLNAGAVLDRGRLHYSFEASVVTTRGLGGAAHDLLTLRPGIIWEIPTKRDTREKSNWIVGGAVNTRLGHDGTDIGVSVKFRYNLDLKRLLGLGPR